MDDVGTGSTNLYYYRARYYSPSLGRFLQTDPIGVRDDLNLYAYTHGDGLNDVDPTGTEVPNDCSTSYEETEGRRPGNRFQCRIQLGKKNDSSKGTTDPERRKPTRTLRNIWEKFWGKKWPWDSEMNRFQEVAHKVAVGDKGAPNDPKNYEPKTHRDHVREHLEKGDFKRWGARSQGGTTIKGGGVLSALSIFTSVVEIRRLEEKHGKLPMEVQLGVMSGELDYETVDSYYESRNEMQRL